MLVRVCGPDTGARWTAGEQQLCAVLSILRLPSCSFDLPTLDAGRTGAWASKRSVLELSDAAAGWCRCGLGP